MAKSNSSGFAAIEAILVLVIVAIAGGTGWYVWHSKQATDKTLTNTANSSSTVSKKSTPIATKSTTTNYVTIKEWGVRAAYTGKLTLSYKIDANGNAEFSAKQLDDLVAGTDVSCTGFAGMIARYAPTQMIDDSSGVTAADAAKTNSSLIHVGSYYYQFVHVQAVCEGTLPASLGADKETQLSTLVTQANSDVKSIAATLQLTD